MKTISIAILAFLGFNALANADDRPNIVLILCDDLGYCDVGFNGSKDIPTPALDSLASTGTIFTAAYCAHPFCGPSRAALMTGRYPHAIGSQFNLPERGTDIGVESGIPLEETFVSKALQQSGYSTGLVGKWHLGKMPKFHPNKRGFDEFYGFLGGGHKYFPNEYRAEYQKRLRAGGNKDIWSYLTPLQHNGEEVTGTEYLTDALSHQGVRFIEESTKKDKPFFLYLSYNAPHTPLEAKQEDLEKLASIQNKTRRTYAAMVHAVDRGVGEIVETLKTAEAYDNTLIVFLSDNGGRLDQGANNAPLKGSKGDTYEGGYRVPMLFHWPNHVPTGKFPHPVSAIDFYPTFLHLAKGTVPNGKQLDGKNIWNDVLASHNARPGEPIFALRHRNGDNEIGVRRDNWKLYRSRKMGWRLFDIEKDIAETNDLSSKYPKQLETMISDLKSWSHTHVQPRWFDSEKVYESWQDNEMPNFEKTFADSNPQTTERIRQEKDEIYSENFDTDPGYISAKGPNDNNISSISFGAGTSKFPKVKTGQYAGTSQYLSGTKITGSTSSGKFSIGSGNNVYDKSRNRTYMTFVDTSKAKTGQYNISFDVGDYRLADENSALLLHVYEGSDTNQGYLEFQVTHQTMLPKHAPSVPSTRGQGGKVESILLDNEILGNGRFSLNFGLSEAGNPGDFLALAWSQVKWRGDKPMPSMSIDNISVSRLPAVKNQNASDDIPPHPLGQTGEWEYLTDFSDEFYSSQVDTEKWNNNPKRYGAMSWDDKNTSQEHGKLRLSLDYEPHRRSGMKLFYKSGMLRSHKQMTYGYYEARMKGCSLFPGACPAFWIFSDGRKYKGEVRYCEVDFAELQMNELDHETGKRNPVNYIDMNLHLRLADEGGKLRWVRPDDNPNMSKNLWKAPWDPRDDFHVYGCDVTPKTITWFVDGKKVASKENKYWHLPMNVALTLELRHPHIGWQGQTIFPVPQAATKEGFPTSMEVDYVRVWERK